MAVHNPSTTWGGGVTNRLRKMPQPVHNAIVTPHNDPHLCLKPPFSLSEHLAQTLTISLCSQTFPVVPKISHVESNISFIRVLRGESSLRREPKYGHRHSITTACGNSRRVNDRVTPDFLFVCHRLVPSFDRAPSPVCLI